MKSWQKRAICHLASRSRQIFLTTFLVYQDHVMRTWLERGAAAEKLLLGFPTSFRAFTLSTSAGGLGARIDGPANPGPYTQQIGVWSHYEVTQCC